MRKTALTSGLISGGVIAPVMYVLLCLARNNANFGISNILMYAAVVMLFIMMSWGIKSYRDNTQDGFITFGKAFKVGILISLVSSLCYAILWLILFNPIFKGFMEQHSAALIGKLKVSGAPVAEIAAKKEEILKHVGLYRNSFIRVVIIFIQAFPVEAIMAVIASFILKRKQPDVV